MKLKLFITCVCLLSAAIANAGVTSTVSDGVLTLTVDNSGISLDGDDGTTYSLFNKAYSNAITDEGKACTTVKVVTANGYKLTKNDMLQIVGDYRAPVNTNMTALDLSDAELANAGDKDKNELNYVQDAKDQGKVYISKLTLPKTGDIPESCFSSNPYLEEVIFPDAGSATVNIGKEAFNECPKLKSVVIGSSVLSIGEQAFAKASDSVLESVIFHEGVQEIGTQAFQNTVKLTSISLPASLRTIGNQAFYGSGLKEVDMDYGITTIGTYAFQNCASLTSIVLPESITTIGAGAFRASAIPTIRIPSHVTTIEEDTFGDCNNLETVTIPAGVGVIKTNAFHDMSNLKHVYVMGAEVKCEKEAFKPELPYASGSDGLSKCVTLHYPAEAAANYKNAIVTTDNGFTETDGIWSYTGENWSSVVDWFSAPEDKEGNNSDKRKVYNGWHQFVSGGVYTPEEDVFIEEKKVGDRWYSLCYPFDVSESMLKSTFGEDVEVVEFSGVDVSTIDGVKTITLRFKDAVTSTKAYYPYMIHPGYHAGDETGTGIVNYIVGIEKKEKPAEMPHKDYDADGVTYSFKGNCDSETTYMKQYSYYYAGGLVNGKSYPIAFYKTLKTTSVFSQYTAVVELSKDNGINNAKASIFTELQTDQDMEDNTATGIIQPAQVLPEAQTTRDNVVRNLNGQVVRMGTTSLSGLPKGIYIVNGRKQVNR